jgi:hypothetical protein
MNRGDGVPPGTPAGFQHASSIKDHPMNRRTMAVGALTGTFCLLAGALLAAALGPAAAFAAAAAPVAPAAAAPAAPAAAKLLPDDALIFACIRDVTALKANFKKTDTYKLYKDPAMQPFVAPAEKKITDFIDERIKDLWQQVGLANAPETMPWPTGRVVLGVRMGTTIRQIPTWDYPDNGPARPGPVREIKTPEPHVILIADMGEQTEPAKAIAAKLLDKAVEKNFVRTKETVRDVAIDVLTQKREAPAGAPADMPPGPPPESFGVAFKDKTILIGSVDMIKAAIIRMGGADQPSLADDRNFRSVMGKLAADQADISFFLSAKALISFINETSSAMSDPEAAEKFKTAVAGLGFDNVKGLGAVASLAPSDKEESRMSVLIGIEGAKRGIMEILSLAPAGLRDQELLHLRHGQHRSGPDPRPHREDRPRRCRRERGRKHGEEFDHRRQRRER